MAETGKAPPPSDLETATLAAQIAEQQKLAAEARKATAVADADAAAAAATSANEVAKAKAEAAKAAADAAKAAADADTAKADAAAAAAKAANEVAKGKADSTKAGSDADKAKAEADKAQMDAVKAGLPTPPDPSKYKVEKPTAPALNATIARLTFEQAKRLAVGFATDIAACIAPFVAGQPGSKDMVPDAAALARVALLSDDAKARTLLALAEATREGMESIDKRLQAATAELGGADKNPIRRTLAIAPATLLTLGTLLENVLAYATILRAQYGFTSVSTVTAAEAALQAEVQGLLVGWKLKLVDTDALLPLAADRSVLARGLNSLRESIAGARKQATDAAKRARDDRETEAGQKTGPASGDDVERLAEALGKIADEADKFVAALFVVDAQGNTPFNAAQRGEALAATLDKLDRTLTLTVKVITSDADTAATDRLFSGFKVYAGNATVARWKLADSDGLVVGAGADMSSLGPTRIPLTG